LHVPSSADSLWFNFDEQRDVGTAEQLTRGIRLGQALDPRLLPGFTFECSKYLFDGIAVKHF